MKIIELEEFESFPIIDRQKQCPTGDYRKIEIFKERCSFGENCNFGGWSDFQRGCSFGIGCNFGENCSFRKNCNFRRSCSFGKICYFGKSCYFQEDCSFGENCHFEKDCVARGIRWDFVYEPPLRTLGRIYPSVATKSHWIERLSKWVDIENEDCYEQIEEKILPFKKQILGWKHWSACEKRILRSWLEDEDKIKLK